MKLEFYNCPRPDSIQSVNLPQTPNFLEYRPDFDLLSEISGEYQNFKNILIIAHGGSLTSFYGYYFALMHKAQKQAYFLNTVDPDYIHDLKAKLKKEETLVISISKSGENVTHLEMTMHFVDYPMVVVTGASSPLRAVADKLKLKLITHPAIGGRYTGLTEVALLPAALMGFDIKSLYKGAQKTFSEYQQDNLAWKAASVFWQLEQTGHVDVFMPFYSHYLFPLSSLIVQLCHESFGKDGKGQTYFAHEAPESQHHTNQRFFGGRKNIAGWFISSETFIHSTNTVYSPAIHSVQIKGRPLFDINKIPLQESVFAELEGTLADARIGGIPSAHLSVSGFFEEELGRFVAFWQLYAVYASVLRNVDPFNQPQVENSKKISFNKRLEYKGLA